MAYFEDNYKEEIQRWEDEGGLIIEKTPRPQTLNLLSQTKNLLIKILKTFNLLK